MTAVARPEPLVDAAYLYDGTPEGLLSAVFLAYERREDPLDVVRQDRFEPRLGQSCITVQTDFGRAQRVRRGIERKGGTKAFAAVLRASACDNADAGTVVYRFVRHLMARPEALKRSPVLEDLANPVVSDLVALSKRAVNEAEKVRQFVRFSRLENGVWFARIAPNVSAVPFVMGYFASRLNDQPFIIYDEAHRLAGVYDGRTWQLVSGEPSDLPEQAADDGLMQEAWRRFYDVLSVEVRYSPELRRRFMPVRLWDNLPEMQPRSCSNLVNCSTRLW